MTHTEDTSFYNADDLEENFTKVPNSLLRHSTLSLETIWLISYFASHSGNWVIQIKQIRHFLEGRLGRDALQDRLKEAEEAGYIKRETYIAAGLKRYKFMVSRYPKFKKCLPCPENQAPENQAPENQALLKKTILKNTNNKKEESSLKGAKERPEAMPPPPDEGPFKDRFEGKIKISQENYDKLISKFNLPSLIEQYAEKLYRWSFNNETSFLRKKRHDLVIEDWIEKDLKEDRPQRESAGGLNEMQKKNWDLNQELVNDLKKQRPDKAGGLNFYYKAHVLKDSKDRSFDISGLVDHETFRRSLEKHLRMYITLGVSHE